jgi:uncharacterized membrane protein
MTIHYTVKSSTPEPNSIMTRTTPPTTTAPQSTTMPPATSEPPAPTPATKCICPGSSALLILVFVTCTIPAVLVVSLFQHWTAVWETLGFPIFALVVVVLVVVTAFMCAGAIVGASQSMKCQAHGEKEVERGEVVFDGEGGKDEGEGEEGKEKGDENEEETSRLMAHGPSTSVSEQRTYRTDIC